MIIVLRPQTSQKSIDEIISRLKEQKLRPVSFEGVKRTVIHVLGDIREVDYTKWESVDCVEKVMRISKPYKLASREHKKQQSIIRAGDITFGNGDFTLIAGPCSIENEEQIMKTAKILKKMGIMIMRASAFKPRTSPYAFQGLGIEGLKLLKKVREETGILVETEVMDVRDVQIAAQYVDILRVGARNMQNFDLLKEMGKIDKPVIIKRGMAATIKEFLMAAEYVLMNGNKNVILCERGIRTFESSYRNTLDINAVAVLKTETHLPVIVDPSHAAGRRDIVPALSKSSVAVGADGLLIEMHHEPEKALSDGAQSLTPQQMEELLEELEPICRAVGKKLLR